MGCNQGSALQGQAASRLICTLARSVAVLAVSVLVEAPLAAFAPVRAGIVLPDIDLR